MSLNNIKVNNTLVTKLKSKSQFDDDILSTKGALEIYQTMGVATQMTTGHNYAINTSKLTWELRGQEVTSLLIPIKEGDIIFIQPGSYVYYTFLTDYVKPVVGEMPYFVSGYGKEIVQTSADTLTVPATAKFLWLYLPWNDANFKGLESVKINGLERYNDNFIIDTLEKLKNSQTPVIEVSANNESVPTENDTIKSYRMNVDYSSDIEYSTSCVDYFYNSSIDLSKPKPVIVSTDTILEGTFKLYISLYSNFQDSWIYENTSSTFTVYNLIPNKHYWYKICRIANSVETIIKSDCITTSGQIRALFISGTNTSNFRDLGGWKCGNSKRIKYGRLIRGGENYRHDGSNIRIDSTGIYEIVNRLKMDVELDIGDLYSDTLLEQEGLEFYNDHDTYGFYSYIEETRGLKSEFGRTLIHNCLALIIDKLNNGKNIYFHCNAGADRTGTLAFLIESICGVDESDLSKDYELTSFSIFGHRKRNVEYQNGGYNGMVNLIKTTFDGSTLQEKVYNLYTLPINQNGLNITSELIRILRNIMIENDV